MCPGCFVQKRGKWHRREKSGIFGFRNGKIKALGPSRGRDETTMKSTKFFDDDKTTRLKLTMYDDDHGCSFSPFLLLLSLASPCP